MSAPKSQRQKAAADAGWTLRIDTSQLQKPVQPVGERRYVLVCVEGTDVGRPTSLDKNEITVGRAATCDLSLHDSRISRQHARIRWVDGRHWLEDLNSGNGTFVGGRRVVQHPLSVGDVVQFGATFAYRYSLLDDERKALMEQLYESSVTDSLTRAYNREYFNKHMQTEMAQSPGTSGGLSLLFLDIDHFKKVNDTYGHAAGDAVLVELVARVKARLRQSDVLCRYGGEEFAAVLRGSDLDTAVRLAERMRQAVRRHPFVHESHRIAVTVSIGCASLDECPDTTIDGLIAKADQRLYVAKHQGRDRVISAD
jgi:two-component system, cell cycle response regulator